MRTRAATLLPLLGAVVLLPALAARGSGRTVAASLVVGGVVRRYELHLPPSGAVGTLPLVLSLHGGLGTPEAESRLTGMDALADREGFLVAYPEGIGRHWNDGRGTRSSADDVGFLSALVDELTARYPVDRARVFATGMSNGAMMSHRLGCELSEKIAAIAPVAGPMPAALAPGCRPARPVSVLQISGTADPIVPYDGGEVKNAGGEVLSAPETFRRWRALCGCVGTPARSVDPDRAHDGTHVVRERSAGCTGGAAVELVTVQRGGHTWPGGRAYLPAAFVGKVSRQLDATKEIWDFFRRHPMR